MGQDIEQEQPGPTFAGAIPFFLSAPLGVASAGAMLWQLGSGALNNSWLPITISLTHLFTLGFLSMISIGSFYVLVTRSLGKTIKGPRLPFVSLFFFILGIAGLCLGLAMSKSTAVFMAIASLFPGLGCFLWPAIAALRGTARDPRAHGLRLAIGSLVVAAFLGLWLAHGHGGMRFPGPRGLWLRVHLAVALLGWIGGVGASAFAVLCGSFGSAIALRRVTSSGIGAALALLLGDYTGLLPFSPSAQTWLTTLAIVPIALVMWMLQPWRGLRALAADPDRVREAVFWRTAFVLAPLCALLAVTSLLTIDHRAALIFGWVAVWGWGGMMTHAMLRTLICPTGPALPDALRRTRPTGTAAAYGLHLASLLLGVGSIATGSDLIARATGICLISLAGVQWTAAISSLRVGRKAT